MKKTLFSIFPLATLILASLACQLPTADQPAPEEETPGEILFQDDFSDPMSGWNRVSAPNGETDYADGVYRIFVNEPNSDIWARPALSFTDVSVEVDTFKVGGDRDNRFGIICRLNAPGNFYTFIISSDGYFGIGKVEDENYQLIGMEALQPTEAIEQGSAINHIRADCVGDMLTLYINGQMVGQVQEADFKTGDVGLIAGTYGTPGTDIRFDNFIVREP
jgi:hypothetical protein